MANEKELFTNRNGERVEISEFRIPAAAMISILRLQEDFAERGEHLSLYGVVTHVIDKGVSSTKHYWAAAEKNKDRRDFAKQAVALFDSNGNVTDMEALKNLAIAKGLVKGSPKQV